MKQSVSGSCNLKRSSSSALPPQLNSHLISTKIRLEKRVRLRSLCVCASACGYVLVYACEDSCLCAVYFFTFFLPLSLPVLFSPFSPFRVRADAIHRYDMTKDHYFPLSNSIVRVSQIRCFVVAFSINDARGFSRFISETAVLSYATRRLPKWDFVTRRSYLVGLTPF